MTSVLPAAPSTSPEAACDLAVLLAGEERALRLIQARAPREEILGCIERAVGALPARTAGLALEPSAAPVA